MKNIVLFLEVAGALTWLFGTAAIFATGAQGLINQWRTPLINWSLIGISFVSVCAMFTVLIATTKP